MREVDLATFAAAVAGGATVIDVREPHEYAAGHVEGARLVPLGQLPGRTGELPRTGPVYVICASGARSLTAAEYLARAGIDARSVAGGTGAWRRSGRPVVAEALQRVF
ncbi:MAG: rhodanese-like domain-containing protein [Dactylosporangium sp.]|nr:rhodanese-like domain-containing protein [Dactylosporangium sp.]NNJ59515.1 rhodanese-like domain-containing protein [Dactylosporangium sp.]